MPATEKQVSKLAHLLKISNLAAYSEIIVNSKQLKSYQPCVEKLKGLTSEQASMLIGLFRPWERSWDETDLGLVKQFIKELKII